MEPMTFLTTHIQRTFFPGVSLAGALFLLACSGPGAPEADGLGGSTNTQDDSAEESSFEDAGKSSEILVDTSGGPSKSGLSGEDALPPLPVEAFDDLIKAAPSKRHDTDVRVLSLNLRVDKTDTNLSGFGTRMPRIEKVVNYYNPDIIGFQESEWDTRYRWKNAFSADYHYYMVTRGGTWGNPDEGVVLLAKKDRFYLEETNYKTFTQRQRRDAGPCKWEPIKTKGNRVTVRMKLRDRMTNEVIDVFNTHLPSDIDCEKIGMAKLQRDYVRKFGDNVILMGDFNTGFNTVGERSPGLIATEYKGYLTETYLYLHKNKDPGEHGHSYITSEANTPRKRIGVKIDHIFVAPAFDIKKAGIDRSLFAGSDRVPCQDSKSRIDSKRERTGCQMGSSRYYWPIDDLEVYSDHWAIWSDVNRKACEKTACAASK